MKDVHWVQGDALIKEINDTWRTDFFKDKAQQDPWLRGVLRRVAKSPHAIATQTHPEERLHFSTFWNIWVFHEHDNPYIFDLGVLHEILHTVLFQKKRHWASTDATWDKMPLSAMEKAVSLRTEVCVYKRWPELRLHTFDFPIWADRVSSWPWWKIKEERERLLNLGRMNAVLEDPEEKRIAKYARMNMRWNEAWKVFGPTVEKAWEASHQHPQNTVLLFESIWGLDNRQGFPFQALANRFGGAKALQSP